MCAAPEPKAARLTGAYTLFRRVPNWLRSVLVSRRISEPSGSGWFGPSMSSRLAWICAAWRAAHISGSQPMTSSGLTCLATQVAAHFLAFVTAARASPPPPTLVLPWLVRAVLLKGAYLVRMTVMAPAAKNSAAATSPATTRHLIFAMRRPSQSRNVVASTVPQDGSAVGRLAGGPAADRVAGTVPGRVAGSPPSRGAGMAPGPGRPGTGLGGGPWRAGTRGGRPGERGGVAGGWGGSASDGAA